MSVIQVSHLTRDYGNNRGIFDVSFVLETGEVTGFLGSNGAGKTTTIRHLMGFMKPEGGTAQILGADCFRQASFVQENIGYLPGEIAFMDNMTGEEFIRFMAAMKKIRDLTKAEALIRYFEIDTRIKIKKMSKGMKQKIGLILAFMPDAPILLLDEPTTGLDPLMQGKFIDLIREEKSRGKTILMSSHIFEEIEHTCDRVIMIKEGRIVADERMEAIKRNACKHYEITFANAEDAARFQKQYAANSSLQSNIVYLLQNENVNFLLSQLCKYDIRDINARPQTLEEVFLKYYGGDRS